MSKYTEEGYAYFPPLVIGGPSGNYVAQCPVGSNEEAEFEIVNVATQDTGTPRVLISGDMIQPGYQIAYDGTLAMGTNNGSDQGSQAFPGVALTGSGSTSIRAPAGRFFPISDSSDRVFVRIDCADMKAVFVTLRYRVRPIRRVVGHVTTVHPEAEQQYNLESERRVMKQLNAETIAQRGEAINL